MIERINHLFQKLIFTEIIDVWINGWNEEYSTVHPKTMNQTVLYALENYPDKRMIIHYMQPHGPYISRSRARSRYRVAEFIRRTLARAPIQYTAWKRGIEYLERFYGLVRLYEENLRIALVYVQELLDNLNGKIVVTADHGELLGENGQFFHGGFNDHQFEETRPDKLIEIPWLEIKRDQPNIKMQQIIGSKVSEILSEADEEIIKDRLKALGYTE